MSQRRRLWGCRQAINVSCIISKYECSTKSLDKSLAGCHRLELAQPGFIKWLSPEIRFCDKKHNLETRIVRASGKVTSQMIEIMSRHSTVAFRRHQTIPYQFISFSIPWIRNAFFSLSKMSIRMISEFVLIFWADRNCYLSEALWRFEMRSC